MTEVVVTTGAMKRAKLQSNRHHKQTNTQLYTGLMPFLSSNQECEIIEGKTGRMFDPQNFIHNCLQPFGTSCAQ